MTHLIHAKNLSVVHGNKTVLEDIDLFIKAKDFITIIGPNGAGKSVLLKCLIGMQQPTKGSIERHHNLRCAYVPQDFNTENTLPISVKNFLTLNNHINEADLQDIAKETNITALLNRQIHSLSGGERQRVLLGRALAKKPSLLVLDEPAQNLDINAQQAFYTLIEDIYHSHDISILMVSHELHLVMACSTRVICLYHHICCSGTPQSVVKDPEFVKIFGADMSNRMAIYHHDHDHSHSHTHDENCQHIAHQEHQ